MSMERAKFKERMKALKAYKDETGKGYWDWRDSVLDNLRNTDDNQYVAETDAIQVNAPFVEEKIKYTAPKPQPTNAVITSDNRSEWKKQQDREKGQRLAKAQKDAENEEKALRAVVTLGLLASPSTYLGPLLKTGGEDYTDALLSGEGTGNILGNVALDIATFGAASAIEQNIAKRAAIKNAFEITNPNATLSTPTPKTITKVGDVEVNVPGLAYRQGDGKMAKDFLQTGVVNSDGNFKNPMFAQGKLWYGVPTEDVSHEPASVVIGGLNLSKRNEVAPKTHLIVSNAQMESADHHSFIRPITVGKKRLGPINDKEMSRWEALGLKDEALRYNDMYYECGLDYGLTTTALGDPVRRVPATSGAATSKNSLLYEFKPGYGYRTVESQPSTSLAFFDWSDPRINFKNGGVVPAYTNGTDGDDDPRELVINRANNVYSNYSSAKDFDLGILEYGARKLSKQLFGRGGISNCTLSATGWIDPQNQYMSARNIVDNPNSGYVEIDKEYALPGDLLISKNPEKDSYHTMLIEGFENDEPLLRYSRGGHDTKKNLVKGRTLSRYHELDNAQGGNHTEDRYFRYKFPGEVWLPEIVITAPRKNIYK